MPEKNKILNIEKLTIGGIEQWIYAKGDPVRPILFFLHGGPGFTELGAHNLFTKKLEDHFLVIHWDQRGAGRSYHDNIPPESMSVVQLTKDSHEIIIHVLKKYGQKKLLLVAHSMGTVIGFDIIKKHPELFHAYVGINQIVHRGKEEERCYKHVIEQAKHENNKKALESLKNIPPPTNGIYVDFSHLAIQRKWLVALGGFTPNKLTAWVTYLAIFFTSEYPWKTRLNMMRSMKFSIESLWKDLSKTDYLKHLHSIDIPVFLLMGRHDRITYVDLAEDLMAKISAPVKQLLLFEKSGHLLCYEEKNKFVGFIISIKKYF